MKNFETELKELNFSELISIEGGVVEGPDGCIVEPKIVILEPKPEEPSLDW